MLAEVFGCRFARFAGASLVDSPGPKLVDLLLLQPGNIGLQGGGPVSFKDLGEFLVPIFENFFSSSICSVTCTKTREY